MNNELIGKRLKTLRLNREKTGVYISTLLGIDQSYYSKMERGKHEIKLETLYRLAEYYNVSLDYLTGRTNNKEVSKWEISK